MDLDALSTQAAAAYAAGDFQEAARIAAEARTAVEAADPTQTVSQLTDGSLKQVAKDP